MKVLKRHWKQTKLLHNIFSMNQQLEIFKIPAKKPLDYVMLSEITEAMRTIGKIAAPNEKIAFYNYFGYFVLTPNNNCLYLKMRRYDVYPKDIWDENFGYVISCYEHLGYKFFFEPQLSN